MEAPGSVIINDESSLLHKGTKRMNSSNGILTRTLHLKAKQNATQMKKTHIKTTVSASNWKALASEP